MVEGGFVDLYELQNTVGNSVNHKKEKSFQKKPQTEAALNRNPLTRIGVGLGRKFSEQTKLKMRNSRLGHKMSEETRAKMRYIMSNRSEEYRANISKAKLGDKNPMFGRRKNALTTTGGTGTEAS